MARKQESERGQSLVMTAAFLLFVGVPVLILVIDGTRLYRAKSLLRLATDAACEDAATAAPDLEHYKQTGEARLHSDHRIWARAHKTYWLIWSPAGGNALGVSSYAVAISPDQARLRMNCTGRASVPLVMLPTTVNLEAAITSSIRFSSP